MNDSMTSTLPDADMQGALGALLRAAQRAREIAALTNTPLVLIRDGVLMEEFVTDAIASPSVVAGYLSQVYFKRRN